MNKTLKELVKEHKGLFYKINETGQGIEVISKYDVIELLKQVREATIKECLSKLTINLVEYAKYGGKIINIENLGEEVSTEDPQKYYQVNKDILIDLNSIEL